MRRMALVVALVGLSLGLCAGRRAAQTAPKPLPEFHSDSSIVRLADPVSGRTFCSGTVVSKKLIVTAAHCVLEMTMFGPVQRSAIQIQTASGAVVASATVVTASPQTDQAVLTGDFSAFKARGLETDPAKDMRALLPNHRLMTCGYPMGGALYCNEFYPVAHHDFWIAGYANMYPGMSGGPVIDMETGKVVAINFAVEGDKALVTPTLEILVHVDKSSL